MTKEVEAFYRENYDELCKRVYHRSGGIHNSEDVVQEAFARALQYWDSFNPHLKELGAWFNTILNNSLRDHMKAERMMGCSVEYDEFLDEPYNPTEEEQELYKVVVRKLEEKEQPYRDVLYLYFIRDYKPKEIARVVELTNANIRKIVERFKVECRDYLGEAIES